MTDKNELFEPENRYCPICDKKIKAGSPLHQCSKKRLKEVEAEYLHCEEEYDDDIEPRTYDDRLQEFEDNYNNDNYYDIEEDE